MHASEQAAERLQELHSADAAVIAGLQARFVQLEHLVTNREHELYETRALATDRERDVCELRACVEGREAALQELSERVMGYEGELDELRRMRGQKEDEVKRTRKKLCKMETERGELVGKVREAERVANELRTRLGEREEGWGMRGISLSSVESSSSGGKEDAGRVSVVAGGGAWRWKHVCEWARRVWRWLFWRRGGERKPLLG